MPISEITAAVFPSFFKPSSDHLIFPTLHYCAAAMAADLGTRGWCVAVVLFLCLILGPRSISAERLPAGSSANGRVDDSKPLLGRLVHSFSKNGSHAHPWPELELGWRVVLGSAIAFAGSALGSVGGVGGGGIFVPMLTLILGFDLKTSAAISKCMIMGAAGATVYYNLRFQHPTLDMPIVDYDLALLFQPMLLLGISIGIAFNVIFAEWMITTILIILFLGTSTKAFLKGIETWKKESVLLKEADKYMGSSNNLRDVPELEYQPLPGVPVVNEKPETSSNGGVSCDVPRGKDTYLNEVLLLLIVWIGFLIIHIIKDNTKICSAEYWILTMLQVPIAASLTLHEAICLYRRKRTIASTGKQDMNWRCHHLAFYCFCGIIAGIVGGLLGLGGGFILGPLFIEMGVPPQVASATSNFIMMFSASMSVIQYYLLHRFPVPYSAYLFCVATLAAVAGQHLVRKVVILIGRASLIIFILALTIFVSAIGIGWLGIEDVLLKIARNENMGFESLCR
ncbi:sulfite exporter TauE/SafE family protein 3-like [Zingiber officinale]|uniref:sulfite exporter TauE/SafE family protein 3-like n=1 Tax=Zingiber officinale TaxID=94328 RepID=UPI001C4BF04C|nr:sulfite exporter TauE/SafE family protein 3-like [Zingiber officinale]